MSPKRLSIVLLSTTLVTMLTLTPAFASGEKEKAASTAPVRLTMWSGFPEIQPVWKTASVDYSKEHPNVSFEFTSFSLREHEQKLQVSLSAGTAPDMADLSSVLTMRIGSQAFLDTVPATYADWIKQNFEPFYTNALTQEGKLYALPLFQGFQALFYNLDDFAAAGISKPPATLDELMDTARKLTKYDANGKVTHAGLSLRLSGQGSGIAEKWENFLFANGGKVLEQTGPGKWKAGFNNEAGYAALNFYLNALYKHKIDSFDVQHDQAAFVAGVASMFNRETNVIGAMATQAPTKKYGITQVVGASTRGTNLNVNGVVIPVSGKNKTAAWDFVKYFLQDKYAVQMMKDVGWISARKGVDYSSVYATEPHFKQALDRPAGFNLHTAVPAVAWNEVYTNLANALTVAFTDATLMDNKPKIMAWLAAQADAANKVLQANKEF